VYGTRPIAISATSASIVSAEPPGRRLDARLQALARRVDRGDLGRQFERHALLLQDALELLADLGIHAGQMRSRNSTTVTCAAEAAPHRAELEPDHAGADHQQLRRTFSSVSAPVDDTMRFSSISMPFSRATSEPVAMTMFFVSTVCVLPSRPSPRSCRAR
jgi:hypothetical protein